MKPLVERLRKQYAGKVEFRAYWDGAGEDLAQQFSVEYVPTFIFVNADGSVAGQYVGGMSEDQLRQRLDTLK